MLLLAACGRQAPAPEAIRIGVLMNLQGSEGPPARDAAQLALSSFTAGGEIDADGARRRVELLFEDTRTAPDEAIASARRLVQQQVVGIIGPGRSREAIAAGGVAENARIPMISPSSTHPQTTAGRRYVFRVAFTDTLQGRALGRFASQELAAPTAAVLYDAASAFNLNLATEFRQTFEAAGGTLVAFESYVTGETDFRDQLERIHQGRPQVLLLPNYPEEIPAQVRQVRALGIDAVLLGGDAWSSVSFAALPEAEGSFFALHWHRDDDAANPAARRFQTEFRGLTGLDPTDHAALTYDAFGLMLRAIARAGDDPDEIRRALEQTSGYRGVTGTITFPGTGGDPAKSLVIARIEDGKAVVFKVVEPALNESS